MKPVRGNNWTLMFRLICYAFERGVKLFLSIETLLLDWKACDFFWWAYLSKIKRAIPNLAQHFIWKRRYIYRKWHVQTFLNLCKKYAPRSFISCLQRIYFNLWTAFAMSTVTFLFFETQRHYSLLLLHLCTSGLLIMTSSARYTPKIRQNYSHPFIHTHILENWFVSNFDWTEFHVDCFLHNQVKTTKFQSLTAACVFRKCNDTPSSRMIWFAASIATSIFTHGCA